MQFYNNIPGLVLGGHVRRSQVCWGGTRGAVFSGAGTRGCVFLACVITVTVTHLLLSISPVNESSYQIAWECPEFFWKQRGLGCDDERRGRGCGGQGACWGAVLFRVTLFNYLSPVMKCNRYGRFLSLPFDSIPVPLKTPLERVDSWEKRFSHKFATCDTGIMAGWLGV